MLLVPDGKTTLPKISKSAVGLVYSIQGTPEVEVNSFIFFILAILSNCKNMSSLFLK
jgi:hypothetical protein